MKVFEMCVIPSLVSFMFCKLVEAAILWQRLTIVDCSLHTNTNTNIYINTNL